MSVDPGQQSGMNIRHEKESEEIAAVYPNGIHGAIAEGLAIARNSTWEPPRSTNPSMD